MTTETCPGCHGSGIEMSGVTYAGHSEYVGCHDCGPGCPSDCGCRVDAEPERPEFAVRAALGATQSPDWSPSATEGLRGPEGAVSDAEAERVWIACGRGICAAESGHEGTCDEASGWADVSPVVAERDFERGKNDRLRVQRDGLRALRVQRDGLRATVRSMLGDAAAEGRCGCVALCEGPQEDCPLHGRDYAWWVGLAGTACADREWLVAENARLRQVAELRVGTWRDTAARLEGERDRARGTAATLEAENARLTEALYLTRITLEATFRVLQEASGLPDDIDDPDCRDEMVLALRPRAEKAEAEVARLRAGIEALAAEWHQAYDPDPIVLTNRMRAADLRALLADTDSAKAEGGE